MKPKPNYLLAHVRAKLEFDHDYLEHWASRGGFGLKEYQQVEGMGYMRAGFVLGLSKEQDRTAPIVEALIECARALEWYAHTSAEADRPIAREALRKLSEVSK